MTCESCAKVNEKYLSKAKGVKSAKVDYSSALATVEFDEKTISETKVKEIVTKNGYGVI